MALWQYRCTGCGAVVRKIGRTSGDLACRCGAAMERCAEGTSGTAMERLDNGAMVREVVRYAGAEDLHKERARNADPLAGGRISVDRTSTK